MSTDRDELLAIYLQDHHAGATSGASLAARIAKSHEGGPDSAELHGLSDDIEQDRELLREIMDGVGAEPSAVMDAAAALGERLGRLKPNGRLVSRSPLSDVVELELMSLGISGKLSCWQALRSASGADPRLSAPALDGLIARAQDQLAIVRRHWERAVTAAFG